MFKVINKTIKAVADIPRRAHVWALVQAHESLKDARTRRFFMLGTALGFGGMAVTHAAHAEGFADMAATAASQATSIKTSAGQIMAGASVPLGGYGGYNWWKKGKEGDSSRVSAGQIAIPLVAGAALGSTGYLLTKAGESVGITATN